MRRYFYKSTKRLQKKSHFKTYFFIFLFLILAGAVVYFLWFWPGFKIQKIIIEGQELVDGQGVEELLRSLLSEKTFYFLPQDKILIFSSKKLREKIIGQFSEIKDVVLKRQLPDVLSLKIEERKKAGIWCQKDADDCFFFDREGIIFYSAPQMISSLSLSIFYSGEQSPKLGQQTIKPDDIEKIFKIKNLCQKNAGVDLTSLENYRPNGFDFEFTTKAGWRVIFSANDDPSQQVYVLSQTLEEEIGENQASLDYIDLRIKNRAYYKYKQE